METIRISVTGMTCAACSSRIEKGIGRMNGVQSASVNLALGQASIIYNPRQLEPKAILNRIEQLGYGAAETKHQAIRGIDSEYRSYRNRFLLTLIVSIPLLWTMLGHMQLVPGSWTPQLFEWPILQWLLASILQFVIGYPFYYGAYQALRQRTANMDVLVVLSTSVAYFYSHYSLFHMDSHHTGHRLIYFDTIAMVMSTIWLGKMLESRAKRSALHELNALYDMQPQRIRIIQDQTPQWISAETLAKGDIVSVLPGEGIPVDGIVLKGTADVDESLLTGESRMIVKSVHDQVYSGSKSVNGHLLIRSDATMKGTRLARMIQLVEQAQSVKPLIQRKVDRVASIFVPLMVIGAILTYVSWVYLSHAPTSSEYAIRNALAVLLVACPCALGLATPVSILVATGLSAKSGILFKEGRSLEILHRADPILIDKTGTLTEGKLHLKSIHCEEGKRNYLLRMAAAIEQHSKHPAGQAIVQAARNLQLLYPDTQGIIEYPGCGVQGMAEGKRVLVGTYKWLLSKGVKPNESLPATHLDHQATVIYVAINEDIAGTIHLTDQIRTEAAHVVGRLKQQRNVWMVTGDREQTALTIAAELGIDTVHADRLPEQKMELIRSLQQAGHRVAMVGDGVNDAAALSIADIGIAMGGGSDAAMQAGDVVLIRSDLAGIEEALRLSQATMKNIHQNLWFALLYNGIAVPFAALGFLDPRVACIGMAASSVIVVSNALRLRNRR